MAKSKNKHKHKCQGKPRGATYADVLARKKAIHDGIEKYAADTALQIEADTRTQRAMWLMVCSIADAFGIGPERMKRDYFPALQANTEELERMKKEVDEEYAFDKLRQRAEQVTDMEITYMYEQEMKVAGMKIGADNGYVPMTRADRIKEKIQAMNTKELALFIDEYMGDRAPDYCPELPECIEALGKEGVPGERCLKCLEQWLDEPAGGAQV